MDGMGYEVGISRTVERKVTFITLIFLRNPNSLPETNIVPEIDGWKMTFPFRMAYFQILMLVSGSVKLIIAICVTNATKPF